MEKRRLTSIDYSKSENILVKPKAVRAKCIECYGGERFHVKNCEDLKCAIYPFRMGVAKKVTGRPSQIKKKCLWCCYNNKKEVNLCHITSCALWPWRSSEQAKLTRSILRLRKGS